MSSVNKRPYTASLVQYVHDPSSGERLNLGLVLCCPTQGFVGARLITRLARISGAFPGADLVAIRHALKSVQAFCDQHPQLRLERGLESNPVFKILPPSVDSGVVLSGQEIAGVTDDPSKALDDLYRLLSLEDDHVMHSYTPVRTDRDVWRSFAHRVAGVPLQEVTRSGLLDYTFHHVWVNGSTNAVEVCSLDLHDAAKIKAHAAKQSGMYNALARAFPDIRIAVLVGEARAGAEQMQAAEIGVQILREQLKGTNTEVVEEKNSDVLASRMREHAH